MVGAAVSELNQPSDSGHDVYPNYQIFCNASIGPDAMHGSVQSTPNALFVFLDMPMVDTYTLTVRLRLQNPLALAPGTRRGLALLEKDLDPSRPRGHTTVDLHGPLAFSPTSYGTLDS